MKRVHRLSNAEAWMLEQALARLVWLLPRWEREAKR